LKERVQDERSPSLESFINDYLDYNIEHDAHWRMITHFALHGNIGEAIRRKSSTSISKTGDGSSGDGD
jgi:hypothetical protein